MVICLAVGCKSATRQEKTKFLVRISQTTMAQKNNT